MGLMSVAVPLPVSCGKERIRTGICLIISVLHIVPNGIMPVSYTHLDVYKRQPVAGAKDNDCPEALLAIAGAASAKRVVGDAVSMVEEERPFQAFFSAHSRHIFHAPIFRLSGVMVW